MVNGREAQVKEENGHQPDGAADQHLYNANQVGSEVDNCLRQHWEQVDHRICNQVGVETNRSILDSLAMEETIDEEARALDLGRLHQG